MINLSNIILDVVNNLFSNLFSSIDSNLYIVLDELVFLSPVSIFQENFMSFFNFTAFSGIITVAKFLAYGICLYYCLTLVLSYFTFSRTEQPLSFIFKLFFALAIITYSQEICYGIIYINNLISELICFIGQKVLAINISFHSYFNFITSYKANFSFNLFSMNGLLEGFISIALIFITLSYTLRFIMIKVFILIFPFAVITLILPNFAWFFKSWLKIFLSLLLLQSFVALILIVSLSLNFKDFPIPSVLALGSVYSLFKANSLLKEFIGGLSTDVNMNLANITNLFKN